MGQQVNTTNLALEIGLKSTQHATPSLGDLVSDI